MNNPLPDDKILAMSKLKACADDNFNLAKILHFSLIKKKTLWEKEKNAGYQHFLLFPQCFQKASSLESFNLGMV